MDSEVAVKLCHSLAKAYSVTVRLYEEDKCLYVYSVCHMAPDPFPPYLDKVLARSERAGIITTELLQFYGYITLSKGQRIILGPTRILQENNRDMELMLAGIGIGKNDKEEYLRLLYSAPVISADRFIWLLSSLMTAIHNEVYPIEDVWFQIKREEDEVSVKSDYVLKRLEMADDEDQRQIVEQSYAWEQMVTSYVENGETEYLRDLFSAPPNIKAGRIAHDGLRQMKNMGICTATGVSRAAIRGGLDPQKAFAMSDLYIQKMEMLRKVSSVESLIQDMIIDFAQMVETVNHPVGGKSRFYILCARYISDNLYSSIKAKDMAENLGYSRAYLCTKFKEDAGISLIHYIQKEKVAEAKRLLQFTDQSLGDIASLLSFSSQSHFQTVFLKVTGETPLSYRLRTKPATKGK